MSPIEKKVSAYILSAIGPGGTFETEDMNIISKNLDINEWDGIGVIYALIDKLVFSSWREVVINDVELTSKRYFTVIDEPMDIARIRLEMRNVTD